MKKTVFLSFALLFSLGFFIESCGPVVITSRVGTAPPPWFYPNRAEVVRYIYFPDYEIYYDFSLRTYLYLDNNIWISTRILPARFNHIDFRRSHRIRINNYFDDDIKIYHSNNSYSKNLNRSNTSRRNTGKKRN